MGNRHVVHTERGWRVQKENAQRPSASADTQTQAVQRAIEIVGNDGGGQVIVHDKNGTIRATHDVGAGGAPSTAETTKVQADAATSKAASGAEQAADKATAATGEARDRVADATEATEQRTESAAAGAQSRVEAAAGLAAQSARQLGNQAGGAIGGTIRRVGGLVRAVGGKAVHTLESTRNIIRRKGSGKD